MAYIGSTPTTQSFVAGTDYFNGTGSQVAFTLSRSVNSVNDIEVIVNNVEQIPSGYSVSGTTLTFSAAPSAGTSNVYVRYLSTTNLSLAIPAGTSATFNTVTATAVNTTSLTTTNGTTIQGLTVGRGAGAVATNTAVGASALAANTSGAYNSVFGYGSLNANTTGQYNTAVGGNTLLANTTGTVNSAFGLAALSANTSGSYNVGIGPDALRFNTTASNNTAVGYVALYSNTTGAPNTAVGRASLYTNTTGSFNVAVGGTDGAINATLGVNTTGSYNTATGYGALGNNTTASNNTAVGYNAGLANTTGAYNTCMGDISGRLITTGSFNTCIGRDSGIGYGAITTGNYNTCLGSGAGVNANNSEYEISIGIDCRGVGNNYFTFGKANGADRVYNNFTSNASWTRVSDVRIKKDIQDSNLGLEFINKLRTVTYKKRAPSEMEKDFVFYKADETDVDHKEKMYGFIAQEVKQALDDVGATDFAGWHQMDNEVQGVSYEMFVMPLVKAIQEQQTLITALTARITALESK